MIVDRQSYSLDVRLDRNLYARMHIYLLSRFGQDFFLFLCERLVYVSGVFVICVQPRIIFLQERFQFNTLYKYYASFHRFHASTTLLLNFTLHNPSLILENDLFLYLS